MLMSEQRSQRTKAHRHRAPSTWSRTGMALSPRENAGVERILFLGRYQLCTVSYKCSFTSLEAIDTFGQGRFAGRPLRSSRVRIGTDTNSTAAKAQLCKAMSIQAVGSIFASWARCWSLLGTTVHIAGYAELAVPQWHPMKIRVVHTPIPVGPQRENTVGSVSLARL